MKKFMVTGIKYDTTDSTFPPQEEISLPKNLIVYCEDEEEVVDAISDYTEFLVESIESIEEISEI